MTFAQRRNRLTTHFSERIPVVKRRISVVWLAGQNLQSEVKTVDGEGLYPWDTRRSRMAPQILSQRSHSEDDSRQQSAAIRSHKHNTRTLHVVLLLLVYDTFRQSIRPSSDSGYKSLTEKCAVETQLIKCYYSIYEYLNKEILLPVPVAARSKAWVYGR